jgi:hypothetical protein
VENTPLRQLPVSFIVTRRHDLSSQRFWSVVEVPDSRAIQEWMSHWTDIIARTTYPILDDQAV